MKEWFFDGFGVLYGSSIQKDYIVGAKLFPRELGLKKVGMKALISRVSNLEEHPNRGSSSSRSRCRGQNHSNPSSPRRQNQVKPENIKEKLRKTIMVKHHNKPPEESQNSSKP